MSASSPPANGSAPVCPLASGRKPRPPKVKGYPLIGNTWTVLSQPWDFLQDCYRTFGPAYRVNVIGKNAVVLAGPDVRQLYSEAGENFLDRTFFYKRLQDGLEANELIFCTKAEPHKNLRRCTSLAYSRQVAAENLPGCADAMVRFFDALTPGQRHDVMKLSTEALISSAGPIIGHCDARPIARDAYVYAETLMLLAARFKTPLARWAPRYRGAKRRCVAFGRDLLTKWRRGEIGSGEGSCVIGFLAEARDRNGQPFSDIDIISMVMLNFVGLGVYTNRVVAFMLYELFRSEALRQQVTAEIDRAYAAGVSYEALSGLSLLRAIYCETLRRYPIWVVVPFRAVGDFEFHGKHISAGELLLISSVQEHFLPEYYPDPRRFDPERCLPPRNEHLRRGAFAPFGAGNRRCVATGQVEMMSLLFVSLLLHRTRFSADPGYRLQVRVRPLPAPRGLYLRFDGMRAPVPSGVASEPVAPRSAVEAMENASGRLSWEETELLRSVLDRECQVCVFPAAAEVFRQGDDPDAFYIVESGSVLVLRSDDSGAEKHLATLGPGDVFGELGLLRKRPRMATIKVGREAPLVALKCDAHAFERLLGELNIVGAELIALIQRRKVAMSLGRLVPGMDRARLRDLVPDATFRRGRAGDVFVREGDASDTLHVIERGRFDVTAEATPGVPRTIGRLEKGNLFGEMGLLRNAPRSATVSVADDCDDAETLVISKEAFLKLIEPGSSLRERVFRDIARRDDVNRAR